MKPAIVGLTAKLPALMAVPAGVVTAIFPVVAPAGTVAVILIGVLTVKAVAAVPLNVTVDAPVKLAPLIVTLVPITPLAGVKLVIRGATVKLVALVAVPPGVVTAIGPVVALPGTVIVICVPELTVKGAARPLSLTEVAPMKFVPVIVTGTPAPAAYRGEAADRGREAHREVGRAGGRAGGRRHRDASGRGPGGHGGRDLDRRIEGDGRRRVVERDRRRVREVGAIDGHARPDSRRSTA